METDLDLSPIRLKSSQDRVDISKLPEEFINSVIAVVEEYKHDPMMIITMYGHMLTGLRINELRDRIILIEKDKVFHPSREFVRKKIVEIYEAIRKHFHKTHGDITLTPQYSDTVSSTSVLSYKQVQTIGDSESEEQDKNETGITGKKGRKRKPKKKAGKK